MKSQLRTRLVLPIALLALLGSTQACGSKSTYEEPFRSPSENTGLRLLFLRVGDTDAEKGMRAAREIARLSEADQARVEAYWGRFSSDARIARRLGHAMMAGELESEHPARALLSAASLEPAAPAEAKPEGESIADDSSSAPAQVSAEPFGITPAPKRARLWYGRALSVELAADRFVSAAEIRCDLTRVYEVLGDFETAFQLAAFRTDSRPLPPAVNQRIELALARIQAGGFRAMPEPMDEPSEG